MDQFRAIGVPADQIVVLQRAAASVANVEQQFAKLMQKSRRGDMLVFCFSGHSGRNTLGMHDRSVPKAGADSGHRVPVPRRPSDALH